MARPSIAANLVKILNVRAGIAAGLSKSRAAREAGTSAGTYTKWLTKYADLLYPITAVPASNKSAYALSPGGRFLFVVDEDDGGLTFHRITTEDGTCLTHRLDQPREPYTWRSVVVAAGAEDGAQMVCVVSPGRLLRWSPDRGEVAPCPLDLSALDVGGRCSTGGREWAYITFTPDLTQAVYWEKSGTLHVVGVEDGVEHLCHTTDNDTSVLPELTLHPRRPLLATMGYNKLVHVVNIQTGEVLVDKGPQVHSTSFGPGDILLCDDWYGKTIQYNYQDGTRTPVGPGWASQASQSSRYINAGQQTVRIRDTADAGIARTLTLDRVRSCQLSEHGRYLAVLTDHVTLWSVEALLSSSEPG